MWLTPGEFRDFGSVGDLAAVVFSWLGCEEHTPGQVEVPVPFECQVCLVGILQLLIALHELDGDVRGVEATHVTNQDIFLPILSWLIAVHLNLGWSYSQRNTWLSPTHFHQLWSCRCFNFIMTWLLQSKPLAVCVTTSQITTNTMRAALFVFIYILKQECKLCHSLSSLKCWLLFFFKRKPFAKEASGTLVTTAPPSGISEEEKSRNRK